MSSRQLLPDVPATGYREGFAAQPRPKRFPGGLSLPARRALSSQAGKARGHGRDHVKETQVAPRRGGDGGAGVP